jgi:hypothetical protein
MYSGASPRAPPTSNNAAFWVCRGLAGDQRSSSAPIPRVYTLGGSVSAAAISCLSYLEALSLASSNLALAGAGC